MISSKTKSFYISKLATFSLIKNVPASSMKLSVSSITKSVDVYKVDYDNLGLSYSADAGSARDAFIKMAKKFHPDSGNPLADETKFKQVETSYRRLLQKFSDERHNHTASEGEYGLYYQEKTKKAADEDMEEESKKGYYTLNHSAPQHRNYLSYEGLGIGTPSQREKQFTKYKAMRATENIIDYKVSQFQKEYPETGMVSKEKIASKKFKTRYGIERVVEDLIQESMAKGDFDNLSNAGKPLQYESYNPYVDVVTHKLNQVLIENGYAPEWVQLEKEIRDEKENIKNILRDKRKSLGSRPWSDSQQSTWDELISSLSEDLASLNKKIDHYNLVVPILNKQLVHYPLNKIASKILNE